MIFRDGVPMRKSGDKGAGPKTGSFFIAPFFSVARLFLVLRVAAGVINQCQDGEKFTLNLLT